VSSRLPVFLTKTLDRFGRQIYLYRYFSPQTAGFLCRHGATQRDCWAVDALVVRLGSF
jgi:hypothetical protein